MAAKSIQARRDKKAKREAAIALFCSNDAKMSFDVDRTVDSTIAQRLQAASAQVQIKASAKLEEQAEELAQLKTNGLKDLLLQQPLVKSLVDTADKLYGWSRNEQPHCLVQVGEMNLLQAKPEQSVIDVKTVAA